MTAQVTYTGSAPEVTHLGLDFTKGVPLTVTNPRKIQHFKVNCHFRCEIPSDQHEEKPKPLTKKKVSKKSK